MFRIISRKSKWFFVCSAVPVVAATPKENLSKKSENARTETEQFVFVETGWDRVRSIFKPTKYEMFSSELRLLSGMTSAAFLIGSVVGSFIYSRHTYMDFVGNNHAAQFESQLDAKAVLTNNMIGSMTRGAFYWGSRTALITFSWILLTRVIRAYQNEKGWADNVGGGVVTGALAGYLFRDLKKLQIEKTIHRGRFIGGPWSIVGGAAAGCLIGGVSGAVDTLSRAESSGPSLRYWEKYWEAHEQEKRRKDPNYKPDN